MLTHFGHPDPESDDSGRGEGFGVPEGGTAQSRRIERVDVEAKHQKFQDLGGSIDSETVGFIQ